MANKLNTALDNIESALKAVTGIRYCERQLILPTHQPRPAIGIVCGGNLRREGKSWTCTAMLQLLTASTRGDVDEGLLDLIQAITDAMDTLANGGSAGAAMDSPDWDPWVMPGTDRGQAVVAGAIGLFRLRVSDPLTAA